MLLDVRPATFPLFAKLPIEVRQKIWALNLPGPRIIKLIKDKDEFYGSAFPVINLSVNRESRHEALKTYLLSFSVNYNSPLIPFNFSTDTLLIGRNVQNSTYFKQNCNEWDLAMVERLVVDRSVKWGTRTLDGRGWRLGSMSHLVFKGVNDYVCLCTGSTDPLPGWADWSWLNNNRTENHDPTDAVEFMQTNWSYLGHHLREVVKQECEDNRFGGIPPWEKYEPSIKRWSIPRIYTMGLPKQVIKAFNHSSVSSSAHIIMDRAIDDLFD
jgi:hypothetical protein